MTLACRCGGKFALSMSKGCLFTHSLVQKRNASHSGGEKASAKHQMKVRQSLASTQKSPSDKWHNEWNVLNVREP